MKVGKSYDLPTKIQLKLLDLNHHKRGEDEGMNELKEYRGDVEDIKLDKDIRNTKKDRNKRSCDYPPL